MTRKFLAFAVLMALTTAAYAQGQGQNPNPEQGQQQQGRFACTLFSVDTDSNQLVVSKGLLGSGNAGDKDSKTPPANAYQVKVTRQTNIHWRGSTDKITLDELREMNNQRLNIPMVIQYTPSSTSDTNDSSQPPKTFTATEISVIRSPRENQPQPRP